MSGNRSKKGSGQESGSDDTRDAIGFTSPDYIEPNQGINVTNDWLVPEDGQRILSDIRACGYSVSRLVDAITGGSTGGTSHASKLGLLGALLSRIKESDEQYGEFLKYQTISEEAELILIEHTLRKQALSGEDVQAIKFFLERRAPDRYARNSKDVNDPQADAISNLVKNLKKNG